MQKNEAKTFAFPTSPLPRAKTHLVKCCWPKIICKTTTAILLQGQTRGEGERGREAEMLVHLWFMPLLLLHPFRTCGTGEAEMIKRRKWSRSLPTRDHTKKKTIMQHMLLALLHGSTPAQNTSSTQPKKAVQLLKTSWLNSPFGFSLGLFLSWIFFCKPLATVLSLWSSRKLHIHPLTTKQCCLLRDFHPR